jgi:hypothetical protein
MCQLYAFLLGMQSYVSFIQVYVRFVHFVLYFFLDQLVVLFCFLGSYPCLFQFLLALEQSIQVERDTYSGKPVVEVVVQWWNFYQNRPIKLISCRQADVRPAFRTK